MIKASEILYNCRKEMGWSMPYLSEQSGTSLYTIRAIERRGDCKVSTLLKLIDAMGFEIVLQRKNIMERSRR